MRAIHCARRGRKGKTRNDVAIVEPTPAALSPALPGGGGGAGFRLSAISLVWLAGGDRKSTRLNSSHLGISDAVFFLKKNIRPSSWPSQDLVCVFMQRRRLPLFVAGVTVKVRQVLTRAHEVRIRPPHGRRVEKIGLHQRNRRLAQGPPRQVREKQCCQCQESQDQPGQNQRCPGLRVHWVTGARERVTFNLAARFCRKFRISVSGFVGWFAIIVYPSPAALSCGVCPLDGSRSDRN